MNRAGFTLTELMMATGISGMVVAGVLSVLFVCNRTWGIANVHMRSMNEANLLLEKMAYGVGGTNGLRSAIHTNVTVLSTNGNWTMDYRSWDRTQYRFAYLSSNAAIVHTRLSEGGNSTTLGTHVVASTLANLTNGVRVMVRVGVKNGRFTATNEASTYVFYRN